MGVFWSDNNPMMMAGAGLPFDLEPSAPAKDLDTFKKSLGLWQTEGVQGVDYFIRVGDVFWNPEIRAYFEAQQNLIHLFGKYHVPAAEVGVLISDRDQALTGYPWGQDLNANLRSSYFLTSPSKQLVDDVARDGLTETDFATPDGNASKYRVIVDSNTSIMDEATVKNLESWVRAGGTFITWMETGRHTPEKFDSWPIAALTGYRVKGMTAYKPNGDPAKTHRVVLAPGQTVLKPDDWAEFGVGEAGLKAQAKTTPQGNGLSLEKVAPEAQDVMLWDDGSTALGVRPLGKGFVVNLGVKFVGAKVYQGNADLTNNLLLALLDWQKVARVPASAANVRLRHYVSNNGLYDVWALWNESKTPVKTDLKFQNGFRPPSIVEVVNNKTMPHNRRRWRRGSARFAVRRQRHARVSIAARGHRKRRRRLVWLAARLVAGHHARTRQGVASSADEVRARFERELALQTARCQCRWSADGGARLR